ncbi:MAG TPA: hypothetical protein VN915_11710 [Elusimicrobiota bacterium]|nr:hypothetical protein [Elusimicrobiota bacterium]
MEFVDLSRAFGNPSPPRTIWQKTFEGSSNHLKNLCAARPESVAAKDLVTYALDLIHIDAFQPDLTTYLFPICLEMWRNVLFDKVDSTFNEHFHHALARRDFLGTQLTSDQRSAAVQFMREALLDCMDLEISHGGPPRSHANSACHWMIALASHGTFATDIESLWLSWWELPTPGRALAALRYASTLIYLDGENPLDSTLPWEYESLGFGERWRDENISFLARTLTIAYFEEKIEAALAKIASSITDADVLKMRSALRINRAIAEKRIMQLPEALATLSSPEPVQWDDLKPNR